MPFVADPPAPPKRGVFVPDGVSLPTPPMVDPTNDAEQRLREREAISVRNQMRKEEADIVKQNAEAGIPLNTRRELPAGTRAMLSAEPDPKVQAAMLMKDGLPARVSKDGRNVIVRTMGDNGKQEDVLLHPFGKPTLGTLAGNAVPIAKTAANVGAAIASSGITSLPIAAASMGLGSALIEGASTGGSRALSGQPLGDTGTRMLEEGTINAALPLAGAAIEGGAKLLRSNPSTLAKNAAAASDRTGVPLFPSQVADSKILARAETAVGLEKLKAEQQGALRTAFDREIGPSGSAGVLSESDIAKKIQPILAADAEAAERSARQTMTAAERQAQDELKSQLDSGLIPTNATNSAVGQNTRQKFNDFVAKVQADAQTNYPIFHAQAEKEGITLDTSPITALVNKIEKEDPAGVAELLAPSVKQVKAVEQKLTGPLSESQPTGLLDARGRPVMTEEVPAPPLTFDEAIRQRAIVRQKISAPDDPLGDVVKSYYKQLEKAYTEAIDDGLKRGTPELRKLYETARGSYAQGADALERGVVQRLFREAGEAGRVPDENVVKQLFGGDGKLESLRDIKNILGKDSSDYKLLVRQGVQNMIDDATQKGAGLVDANAFLTRFNSLDKEMRAEMFGALEAPLKATVDALRVAQQGASKVARIPVDELNDALAASPGSVKTLIRQAVDRQRAYEAEYTNGIMKRLTGGNLGIKDLGNLDRFTAEFVPQASASDMRQILTRIEAASPGSADQLRQRVLANIRQDVTEVKPVGAKTTGEIFDLNPDAIKKYTEGPEAEKYRAILGDKGIQFLEDMATIAESNLQRIARGEKNSITARVFGKEALSGGAGFVRNAISTGVDLASIIPRAILGNAERFSAVREFLVNGNLPALGRKTLKAGGIEATDREVRGMALAVTPAARGTTQVLSDNANMDTQKPLTDKPKPK